MSEETSFDDGSVTSTESRTWSVTLRAVAVAALLGAAAIHFAYAPAHFDEETSHGVFFIVVAWAQVGALAALLRWRDRPEPWFGAAAVSLGVTVVWLVSRTTGLPGESAESLGWADGMAASLQAVTLGAAAAALMPKVANRAAPSFSPALGAVAAVALLGSVSVVLNPSLGHDDDDHSHGDDQALASEDHAHGDDDGHGDHDAEPASLVEVDRDDRCDVGFNTAAFNETAPPTEPVIHDDSGEHEVDFTLEEWADVFVQPDNDMTDGTTPEEAVEFLQSDNQLADGITSGGVAHSLEPDNWSPMTDHEECQQLAEELERTQAVAEAHPTAQDAIDAGYRMVTPYLPAISSHYLNPDYMGEFDIDNPAMLLYDGNGPDAQIMGVSHYILHDPDSYPDVGFTGPNDHWHRHFGLCMRDGLVAGGTNLTEEECAEIGGSKNDGSNQWMNHIWIVPGCESDWGLFSAANPAIPTRSPSSDDPFDPDDLRDEVPSGCGSGKSLDDEPDFDEGGHGPSL